MDLLLEAVRILKQKTSFSFLLRLAGRGAIRPDLEFMAEQLEVDDRVKFLGRITREEMQVEMQHSNCFVLPSRYEAFGAVLIEAMATGMPLIATRSGGPGFIVTKQNGLLIDPEDAGQLAGAMEQMITSYGSYSQKSIRARTLKLYGQTNVMEQYDELFRQLLQD